MKEGMVAVITAMMATDPSYEKVESEVFKPYHQQMVDAGAKSFWGLNRVIFPAGSDRYASHILATMYEDMSQYVEARGYEVPESSLILDLAVQEGLKTRDRPQSWRRWSRSCADETGRYGELIRLLAGKPLN